MNPPTKLSILICSSLLLVACQSENINSETANTDAPTGNTTSISASDEANYNGAVQLMDKSFCDKISSKELLSQCNTEISNSLLQKEALSSLNEKKCEAIIGLDLSEACKIRVQIAIAAEEKAKEFEKSINEQNALMQQIVESNNISKCKEIEDTNIAMSCEVNILIKEGLQKNRIEICENATSLMATEICQTNLAAALELDTFPN